RILCPNQVQPDAVEVALDEHRRAPLADLLAGKVEAVQRLAFAVEARLPRVEILGPFGPLEQPPAEGDRPPLRRADGDDWPPAEGCMVPLGGGPLWHQARPDPPLQHSRLEKPVRKVRP